MPLVLIPVAILLAAYVSYAISTQSSTWADALANWLIAPILRIPILGKKIEGWIASGAAWLSNRFGGYFIRHVDQAVGWVVGLSEYVRLMAAAAASPALLLPELVRWLVGTKIPALIRALPNTVTHVVHSLQTIVHSTTRTVTNVVRLSRSQVRAAVATAFPGLAPVLPELAWIRHHWRGVVKAVTAVTVPVAGLWPEIHGLTKRNAGILKRLRKVEALLGVTGMAAAVAAVLHVTPSCLRSGNIGKAARFLCGMDSVLLGSLLSGLFEAMVVSDLCEFAAVLGDSVGAIEPALAAFADVENALLGCPQASFPSALSVPPLDLPTSPPLLALAA